MGLGYSSTVECFPSMCEALGYPPASHKPAVVLHASELNLGRWRHEDQNLKVILRYIQSSRLAGAI